MTSAFHNISLGVHEVNNIMFCTFWSEGSPKCFLPQNAILNHLTNNLSERFSCEKWHFRPSIQFVWKHQRIDWYWGPKSKYYTYPALSENEFCWFLKVMETRIWQWTHAYKWQVETKEYSVNYSEKGAFDIFANY